VSLKVRSIVHVFLVHGWSGILVIASHGSICIRCTLTYFVCKCFRCGHEYWFVEPPRDQVAKSCHIDLVRNALTVDVWEGVINPFAFL